MIDLSFLSGKKIGVVGLGKSGLAAAQALLKSGTQIWAWDDLEIKRKEAQDVQIPVADLSGMLTDLDFLLWSPGIPHYGPNANPLAVKAKEAGVELICDIDLLAQGTSSDILAITGTNGKSTTTALLGHILSQFRAVEVGGNIGRAALSLDAVPDDGCYVLELSSYQLELSPHLKPRGAVLLNITPDHLARHGDMAAYVAAKTNIFAHGMQKAVAVICTDGEITQSIADKTDATGNWKVIRVSTKQELPDSVFVNQGKLYDRGSFVIDLAEIPTLQGVHNHENAACAYALVRYCYHYEPQAIAKAMTSFAGLPHRQHLVRTIGEIAYVNDSKATNADAVSYALACRNDIYWILGGQSKDGGLKGLETYMEKVRHAYVIGQASEEFSQWLKNNNVPVSESGVLERAVAQAHEDAQNAGAGTVLLSPACASWDQFRSFEHRGEVFADLVMALDTV